MEVDSPVQPAQLPCETDLEVCTSDIVGLMQAMYSRFRVDVDDNELSNGVCFADTALAFGLTEVYQGILGDHAAVTCHALMHLVMHCLYWPADTSRGAAGGGLVAKSLVHA